MNDVASDDGATMKCLQINSRPQVRAGCLKKHQALRAANYMLTMPAASMGVVTCLRGDSESLVTAARIDEQPHPAP